MINPLLNNLNKNFIANSHLVNKKDRIVIISTTSYNRLTVPKEFKVDQRTFEQLLTVVGDAVTYIKSINPIDPFCMSLIDTSNSANLSKKTGRGWIYSVLNYTTLDTTVEAIINQHCSSVLSLTLLNRIRKPLNTFLTDIIFRTIWWIPVSNNNNSIVIDPHTVSFNGIKLSLMDEYRNLIELSI